MLIIKIERSGGLAGISTYSELNSNNLPSSLEHTVKKILTSPKAPALQFKAPPKGAADLYTYKISVKDGTNENMVECSQYDIRDDLKSLIKYVEKNSKKS